MKDASTIARYAAWFWLLWPPAWARIFSSSKDLSAGGVLGSTVLNGAGLHVWRKRLAHRLCAWRRAGMRARLPEGVTREWDQAGLVRVNNFLSPEQWLGLRDELLSAALPMTAMTQPPALTRRAYLDAHYCRNRYPNLLQLITDDRLLGLLHYAAGYRGKPVVAVQCVHSSVQLPGGAADPQTEWHADTYHSTAKAWFFLHPVGADDGPFSYWSGSHALTAERLQWEHAASVVAAAHPNRLHARGSFRTEELEVQAMGYGAPMIVEVPANTLVVADTSGFHRRTPSPHPTVRVEVYFSLRRNPFFAGLVPGLLGWPVLRNRWAGWLYAWYAWLQSRGHPSWIPQPESGLNDLERQALLAAVSLNSVP